MLALVLGTVLWADADAKHFCATSPHAPSAADTGFCSSAGAGTWTCPWGQHTRCLYTYADLRNGSLLCLGGALVGPRVMLVLGKHKWGAKPGPPLPSKIQVLGREGKQAPTSDCITHPSVNNCGGVRRAGVVGASGPRPQAPFPGWRLPPPAANSLQSQFLTLPRKEPTCLNTPGGSISPGGSLHAMTD